jgi:hypothetical protein
MDYYNLTSQETLERLSRHCPEAISTYLQCVNRCQKDGTFFFSKDIIEVEMSEDFRTFRQNIKKLARENLLEWHPFNNGISITLAGSDEND